jgi:hypothetical protein
VRSSKSLNRNRIKWACACAAALLASRPLLGQVSGTWLGGAGSWSDPTRWTSNPNVPGNGGAAHSGRR